MKLGKNYFEIEINSAYITFLKKRKTMILVSLFIAVFLTILTYPGILYSDSYSRIGYAQNFRLWIHNLFEGNTSLVQDGVWLTLEPSFFIYLSLRLTGNISMYTFMQCFLCYFTAFVLAGELSRHNYRIIYGGILLTPVFAAYSVYYEAGVGCAIAIVWILILIWKWDRLKNKLDQVISCILLVVFSFIAFGYRANAFTIIPIICIITFWKYRIKIKSIVITCCMFIGFLLVTALPLVLHIDTMSSYAAGFVWEIVSTIQNMDEVKKESYLTYLDDIFGEGTTRNAVDINTSTEQAEWNICPLLGAVNVGMLSEQETKNVINKYISIAKEEPRDFIKTKSYFTAGTLGITEPLKMVEYDYDRWGGMSEYGFNDCVQRKSFVDFFLSYMEFMKLFRSPWIMYLLAAGCLISERIRAKMELKNITLQEAMFLTSVFYYGAFILNNQSFEFRYFFPSWLLLFFVIIATISNIIQLIEAKSVLKYSIFYLILAGCLFGGYIKLTEYGDEMLSDVENNARLVYSREEQKIYYKDGKLYFVFDQKADTEYQVFLHYFPIEGEGINHDFRFLENCEYTSFWNKKIVVKEIPLQMLSRLEFGQYYGAVRFWEYQCEISEFVSPAETISVLDFNEEGWTNGYSDSEYCFLAEKMDLENFMLVGKKLVLPDGNVMRVTNVLNVNNYQRIYTEGDIAAYGERIYKTE